MTLITLIVLLSGPAATPRDALLLCLPDGPDHTLCEAYVIDTPIPLEECLEDTWAYTHDDAEEPTTVLGCSPDGRTLVLDPDGIEHAHRRDQQ